MALDVIAGILIILFFIRGYMKGIIVAAFSVLAIILGIICSLKLSGLLATYLLDKGYISSGWAQLVSYIVLFATVVLCVRLLAKAIEKSMEAFMLGWVNRSLGGLLYVFIAIMAWSTILWLGNEMKIIKQEQIAASKTYQYIVPVAPWVADKTGELWPMAKDVFIELESFFNHVNLPQDVDTAG